MTKINFKEVDTKTIDEIHTIYALLADLSNMMNDDRERGIELYEIAKENYEDIKAKTENDDLPSDEGLIEEAMNNAIDKMVNAYKVLTDGSNKIPKVMEVISKLGVAKYHGEVMLRISGHSEKEIDINDPDDKLKLLRARKAGKFLNDRQKAEYGEGSD